ncbi:glycosyltransferase family 39 protein [Deltaproteobacteria bacterium TL4]
MHRIRNDLTFRWMFIVLGLTAIFLFWGLSAAPLIDWDENIYAEASRQMVERGDYLNVTVNNLAFTEKPPFFFWLQAASYHVFGINEFAARFPSALAGVMMGVFCLFLGKWLDSLQLGVLWALIYLSSFFPSILGHTAIIDHTFNLLISTGTFGLYIYDVLYKRYLMTEASERSQKQYWMALTGASVCIGLAVLTKGPFGGVVPLVAFAGYKWAYRFPRISLRHFIYCGVLSLSIALSWYLVNWLLEGTEFILNFINYQLRLLSKPLQGHQGPFYYHLLVIPIGFLPWTPFLCFKKRSLMDSNPHVRPLLIMGGTWCGFVLLFFSSITTKLPHYTASVYLPLSLAVAWGLHAQTGSHTPSSKKVMVAYVFGGMLLALLVTGGIFGLQHLMEKNAAPVDVSWTAGIFIAGAGLLMAVLVGAWFLWRNQILSAVFATVFGMAIFTQGVWHYQVPLYLAYTQNPMISLVHEAQQRQAKVVFFRYISFAALFYGKQPIEMIDVSMFPGNIETLKHRHEVDLHVITDIKEKLYVQRHFPLAIHKKDVGTYSLFIIPSQGNSNSS